MNAPTFKYLNHSAIVMAAVVFAISSSANAQQFQQYSPQPVQQYQQYGRGIQSPNSTYNQQVHWSQKFKPEIREMDFGAVPRASKQEVVFKFKNTMDQTLYLTRVKVSCGCTIPKILTPKVEPGQIAKIHAKFDTLKFQGQKQATLSVGLQRNRPFVEGAEIQFMVKGKIRQDVVFNPGEVSFKNVNPGEEAIRTARVMYAGNPAWQIVDVKSTNENIKIEKSELLRDPNSRRVDYELKMKLSADQPMGAFTDQLTIITNDAAQPKISVNILGNVQPILQVAPVQLGVIERNKKVEKKLILKGSRPFSVRSISTGDDRIQFNSAEGKKTLHILTYRLDTSTEGDINSDIKIETDDPGQPFATVRFDASVSEKTFTAGK